MTLITFWFLRTAFNMTFEQAYHRLEEIHTLLQSDDLIDIEKISALQKEAKICYEFCRWMIDSTTIENWSS